MAVLNRTASCCCALVALGLAPGVSADVYKCAGNAGIPVYQEMPCPKGKELRNFQTDPPEITILPALPRTGAAPIEKGSPPVDARSAKDAKAVKDAKDARPGKSAQAGDASERKFLRTGMTDGEVLAKLGPADMTTGAKNGTTVRWTYMPAPGDAETITSVTLSKGRVTEIERKAIRK